MRPALSARWMIAALVMILLGTGCGPGAVAARIGAPEAVFSPGECGLHMDAEIFDAVHRLMAGTRRRLWVEMYEFGRQDLARAMMAATGRGVDVRLVSDPSVGQSRVMVVHLASAGLPVRMYPLDDSRHQIDHVKLLLTDTRALVAGMNWGTASSHNHDYGLEICAPPLLERLRGIFEQDWSISGGVPAAVRGAGGTVLQTSPGGEIRDALNGLLAAARSEIRAEIFTLTDHEVLAGLAQAARRGVRVRVLLDPNQDVNRPAYDLLRAVGVEARWYPVPPGAKLHAKAGLFDGTLLLGSANWSLSGLSVNHELDVQTKETAPVQAFSRRFDADWATAGGWFASG